MTPSRRTHDARLRATRSGDHSPDLTTSRLMHVMHVDELTFRSEAPASELREGLRWKRIREDEVWCTLPPCLGLGRLDLDANDCTTVTRRLTPHVRSPALVFGACSIGVLHSFEATPWSLLSSYSGSLFSLHTAYLFQTNEPLFKHTGPLSPSSLCCQLDNHRPLLIFNSFLMRWTTMLNELEWILLRTLSLRRSVQNHPRPSLNYLKKEKRNSKVIVMCIES